MLGFLQGEEYLKKGFVDCFWVKNRQNEVVAYRLDNLGWNCYMAEAVEKFDFHKALEDLDSNSVE